MGEEGITSPGIVYLLITVLVRTQPTLISPYLVSLTHYTNCWKPIPPEVRRHAVSVHLQVQELVDNLR
jgi:hypothetical protein